MHSDTAASSAGRDAPDLDSDYHSDDDQEASGRAGKRRRLVSVSCVILARYMSSCLGDQYSLLVPTDAS